MADQDDLQAKRQSLGDQTLSITVEQYLDFISETQADGPCEACGKREWVYAQDNDEPAIMATVNVRDHGTSNWFFFMTCGHCANTRLLGAGLIWNYYFGTGRSNNE